MVFIVNNNEPVCNKAIFKLCYMVCNFNNFEPLSVTCSLIHLPTVRHIVMLTHRSLCSGKAAAKPKPSDTSAQQAPQLVTALKDSQVNEGEAVTMSCKILAVPGTCKTYTIIFQETAKLLASQFRRSNEKDLDKLPRAKPNNRTHECRCRRAINLLN